MAKVWNTVYASGSIDYTKSSEDLLTKNEIPFSISENKIHFISDKYSVSVASREYDEPYSLFCMQLCDTVEGNIGMGTAPLSDEIINVIGEVFDEVDLTVTMEVSSSYGSEEKTIYFEKDESKGNYYLEVDLEVHEDEDEDWE